MWHHHNREDDPPDHIAHDHLDKGDISAIGHGWNTDDRERAGFGGNNGKADAPPWNIFAPQKIIASVSLVFAEPHPEADDARQVNGNDQPIGSVKKCRMHTRDQTEELR